MQEQRLISLYMTVDQLTSVLCCIVYMYNSPGTDSAFIGTVRVLPILIKVGSN